MGQVLAPVDCQCPSNLATASSRPRSFLLPLEGSSSGVLLLPANQDETDSFKHAYYQFLLFFSFSSAAGLLRSLLFRCYGAMSRFSRVMCVGQGLKECEAVVESIERATWRAQLHEKNRALVAKECSPRTETSHFKGHEAAEWRKQPTQTQCQQCCTGGAPGQCETPRLTSPGNQQNIRFQ
eukprot:852557-Rhodomonas_salina.1